MATITKDTERTARITFPTASFSLTKSHIAWIAKQSVARGMSKSELLRDLLDRAIEAEEKGQAA